MMNRMGLSLPLLLESQRNTKEMMPITSHDLDCVENLSIRTPLILESSSNVIGNCGVQVPFDLNWRALMPFSTCSKCAIALMFGFG